MNQQLLVHVASQGIKKNTPKINSGMTVKVSQKIKEGEKERIQNFEGLVIATNGKKGADGTFTVRKIIKGYGVEKVFALHSKTIVKIEVIKEAKIRRSKLYYMRDLRGKAARMQENYVREIIHDAEAEAKEDADKAEQSDVENVSSDESTQAEDGHKEEAKEAGEVAKKTESDSVNKNAEVKSEAEEQKKSSGEEIQTDKSEDSKIVEADKNSEAKEE